MTPACLGPARVAKCRLPCSAAAGVNEYSGRGQRFVGLFHMLNAEKRHSSALRVAMAWGASVIVIGWVACSLHGWCGPSGMGNESRRLLGTDYMQVPAWWHGFSQPPTPQHPPTIPTPSLCLLCSIVFLILCATGTFPASVSDMKAINVYGIYLAKYSVRLGRNGTKPCGGFAGASNASSATANTRSSHQ